jgi:integrase
MAPNRLQATRYPGLFIRGRVYYVRTALPSLVEDGRWEVCFSLRTSDPALAKMLAAKIKARVMELANSSKIELANDQVRERLRKLAREYFLDELEKLNEQIELDEGTPDWNPDELAEDTKILIEKYAAALKQTQFSGYITAKADELLAEHLSGGRKNLEIKSFLQKMLVRGEIEANRIFMAKVAGNYDAVRITDELFAGLDPDVIRPVPDVGEAGNLIYRKRQGAETLDKAIGDYLNSKLAKDKDEKTVKDIELSLRVFQLMYPEIKYLPEITKAIVLDFDTRIAAMPVNFTKSKVLKGESYENIVVLGKDMPKMSAASQDKYIMNLRSFIKWCQQTDRLNLGMLPSFEPKDKTPDKEKRDPFTAEELKKYFSCPQYVGHGKKRYQPGQEITYDYFYWVPLVALYCGMRLGEIIQLHLADFRQEAGIYYFDITPEGGNKSVKNVSSRRKVPLHPELLRMGFLKYVEQSKKVGHERLFYDAPVTSRGKMGDESSRRFARFFVSIGIKRKKLVFHSFRHTFIDYALKQAKLPIHLVKALAGHTDGSITTGVYGGSFALPELHDAISKITFPINLAPPALCNQLHAK